MFPQKNPDETADVSTATRGVHCPPQAAAEQVGNNRATDHAVDVC